MLVGADRSWASARASLRCTGGRDRHNGRSHAKAGGTTHNTFRNGIRTRAENNLREAAGIAVLIG